jgi:hypothetical protein
MQASPRLAVGKKLPSLHDTELQRWNESIRTRNHANCFSQGYRKPHYSLIHCSTSFCSNLPPNASVNWADDKLVMATPHDYKSH